eukprot:7321796-Ditylum_brightwellii.AAC.1
MDILIKNQIKAAMDLVWLSQIHSEEHSFRNRTVLDIFQHQFATYGAVGPDELTKNQEKVLTPTELHQTIALLFKQIENGITFATSCHKSLVLRIF